MATVIHIKDAPPGWRDDPAYVYVGRPRKGMNGLFGNPFPKNESRTREEAIEAYRRYASERVDNLVQLLLIDSLCRMVLGFSPDLLSGPSLWEGLAGCGGFFADR